MPRAAVKLPSDPPPVEDSSSLTPRSAASLRASVNSAATPLLRSIGGRLRPRSIRGCSVCRWLQRAELAIEYFGVDEVRDAEIDLGRRFGCDYVGAGSAEMTPGFTVMPRLISVKPETTSIWRASSTTALEPFAKSTPRETRCRALSK